MDLPAPSVEINFENDEELTASELSEPPFPALPPFPPLPTTTADAQADGASVQSGYQASEVTETDPLEFGMNVLDKKFKALAICCITRDLEATESIGSIATGTTVTAIERKGTRIKIKIPTAAPGVEVTGPHTVGWIDVECSTELPSLRGSVRTADPGERIIKQVPSMQALLPDEDCPGPAYGRGYPVPFQPPPGMRMESGMVSPPVLVHSMPYMPMAPPPFAPAGPPVPSLPFKHRLVMAPPLPPPKGSLVVEREGSLQAPEPASEDLTRGERDADDIPLPEEFPQLRPSMRRRSFPIPTPAPMPTSVNPVKSTQPAPRRSRPKRMGQRDVGKGRRRMMVDYLDPHQALVSNTPGVVLYPRDPRTGAVIIPKHLRRRPRSRRGLRSRRRNSNM